MTGNRQQGCDGAGWEFVHVAIDDASRLAFTSLHPNERGSSACRALVQAMRYYRGLSIRFDRVMTDNGACYRSRSFRRLCARLGLKHIRTKPYTPRTNGKAERFIRRACGNGPMHAATTAPSNAPGITHVAASLQQAQATFPPQLPTANQSRSVATE